MSDNKVKWTAYDFEVCEMAGTWNPVAGVYIFTGLTPLNQWRPYYIGQAESFKDRFANHERWEEAARLGATRVHARVVPLAATRGAIERELIRIYQPKLNTHHIGT